MKPLKVVSPRSCSTPEGLWNLLFSTLSPSWSTWRFCSKDWIIT
ncbi:hypothetical protein [Nonomuraea dietziae]|uniref:Uncharacterized protein n=1 Tax=Nonomuraea dietziae TaxID=65515 RepID=A0A7W5YD16_9ACTN|nr:hypothetical protein [Nonomuraea dietziae]MBB3729908.1 hypothetical protein [Nonomuraea dietziae]